MKRPPKLPVIFTRMKLALSWLRGRDDLDIPNPAGGREAGYPFRDRILKLTDQELVYMQGKDSGPNAAGEKIHLTKRWSERLLALGFNTYGS